ncbi:uncharacterized protein STEHIDRAFT_82241 [Stereum hirsutum FP-91666 SS1]|uniref:uncharacterized protein n=1 Tax=Stereum hirsutum (strain FP-91666) TaxID=721885 RepID=UPI0004449B83|nr:uncharacterized protein STEHIDRAFT_82241 [Stereum hirsutum FP-91666 SS1]EIM84325.1 hypothetical protein STEHIDRAFT_82241 [Stereum hirsutum FP-91666 SS1]
MAARAILRPQLLALNRVFNPSITTLNPVQHGTRVGGESAHALTVQLPVRHLRTSSIADLQSAFRDPTSPYHLPPGAQGPAHPDDHGIEESEPVSAAEEAKATFIQQGYDPSSFWEQSIVWGDHDAFQHVNNVRYVRFFESGRMVWINAVGNTLGGPEKANGMLSAKGISFILKSIEVKFRRPVRFPDTLLIAHRVERWPDAPSTSSSSSKSSPPLTRTQFYLHGAAYSYAQRAVVADSTSVITWYDYDKLKKCDPGDEAWAALFERMQ